MEDSSNKPVETTSSTSSSIPPLYTNEKDVDMNSILYPYKTKKDIENGTGFDYVTAMKEYEPHRVFKHLPYPKTGGRLGNCYLLWGNELKHDFFPLVAIVGPNYFHAIFMLYLPIFVFLCFMGSMKYMDAWQNWELIVEGVICIADEFCFCMTILSNPGTVFRGSHPYNPGHKWNCEKCKMSRPSVFVHHCEECDLCCYRLDHHCIWMGKCIGKRTLFWFNASLLLFVTSMVVSSIFPFIISYVV